MQRGNQKSPGVKSLDIVAGAFASRDIALFKIGREGVQGRNERGNAIVDDEFRIILLSGKSCFLSNCFSHLLCIFSHLP